MGNGERRGISAGSLPPVEDTHRGETQVLREVSKGGLRHQGPCWSSAVQKRTQKESLK